MRIILPAEVDQTEGLRKSIAALVRDPRDRRFEQLRAEGFDSETAAELSGINDMDPVSRANIVLGSQAMAIEATRGVADTAVAVASTGFRTVGAQAGSSLFNALGMAVIRGAVQNSAALSVTGTAVVGAAVAFGAGKLVSSSLGAAAGIAAAAGVGLSTALVALAILRRLR